MKTCLCRMRTSKAHISLRISAFPVRRLDSTIPILAIAEILSRQLVSVAEQSKKISNDQELIQSDPISCPQNQKGNNEIHKLTTVYERHSRQTE